MAKNRRTIITELFQAFAQYEDFQYDEEQLWEIFNACVADPHIKLKKLSKEREKASSTDDLEKPKSRGKTGYQHFLSEFSQEIPEGMKKREFKGAAWKALSDEEREEWNKKANIINEANGFQKKSSTTNIIQDMDQWKQDWIIWNSSDPNTRGQEPIRPGSNNSSPHNSTPSSPKDTSPSSTHIHNESDDDDDEDDDDEINRKLKHCQKLKESNDSSKDDDDDSDDDDSDDDNSDSEDNTSLRIKWLKDINGEAGWKKNPSSNFKAWIIFTNTDIFGPDKDNTISSTQFAEFKQKYDYASRAKDPTAPWSNFIVQNAIA